MPQTIALVDDDRNILTSVSMALEAEGFTVRTYTDGAEALRALMQQPVDLAVLDIKMPRMDGMELLAQLRKASDLPVIFLTSKDDEVDELLGLRMGADDYIKKPFSQRLLIERIRALLRREAAEAAAPATSPESRHRPRRADARPCPAPLHLEERAGGADRHRVPAAQIAGAAPGSCEEPRPADGRRLWRAHLC